MPKRIAPAQQCVGTRVLKFIHSRYAAQADEPMIGQGDNVIEAAHVRAAGHQAAE